LINVNKEACKIHSRHFINLYKIRSKPTENVGEISSLNKAFSLIPIGQNGTRSFHTFTTSFCQDSSFWVL